MTRTSLPTWRLKLQVILPYQDRLVTEDVQTTVNMEMENKFPYQYFSTPGLNLPRLFFPPVQGGTVTEGIQTDRLGMNSELKTLLIFHP